MPQGAINQFRSKLKPRFRIYHTWYSLIFLELDPTPPHRVLNKKAIVIRKWEPHGSIGL